MKPELTASEYRDLTVRVLQCLGIGKNNAILLRNLIQTLGADERKIRLAIEELRHQKYPICISSSPPYGYFIAGEQAEVDEFVEYFRSRIINECLILRDVKLGAKERLGKQVQLPLFLT